MFCRQSISWLLYYSPNEKVSYHVLEFIKTCNTCTNKYILFLENEEQSGSFASNNHADQRKD